MNYILIGVAFIFIALAYCIWKLKWDFLISGYNTASTEEKKKVKIEIVRKRMGIMLFVMAGVFFLMGLFGETYSFLLTSFPFIMVVLAVITIIWVNKGTTEGNNTETKGAIVVCLLISVPILIMLGALFSFSTKPMEVTINKDRSNFSISGPKSETIYFKDIDSIEIVDNIPKTTMKVNGVGIGEVQAGTYKLESGEKVTLHIQSKNPRCILIKMNNGRQDVYINFKDDSITDRVYKDIKNNLE